MLDNRASLVAGGSLNPICKQQVLQRFHGKLKLFKQQPLTCMVNSRLRVRIPSLPPLCSVTV